jgi:acyl carrier protein
VVPLDLRDRLAGQLPSYMVPALWAVVDSIPVTANGKVDRRALVAAAGPAGTPRAPSAQTRALPRIQALFAEVIGPAGSPAELTAETDFFMAGGNSLAAIRLMGLVRKQLGVTLPLRDFLLAPTPTGLSQLVDKARSDKARSDKARSGLS